MTEMMNLVYNTLIADEKLKTGTKYERLTAIAFKILTGETTVHDLRLRGSIGVPHQIDAVVGEGRKRVLIEAKDFDRKVDLPIVRSFWAVVEDVKPAEAFVVTTVGFSKNAVAYAQAKGLRLAVLRNPQEPVDWQNILRRITVRTIQMAPGVPEVSFRADEGDHRQAEEVRTLAMTEGILLVDENGDSADFHQVLQREIDEQYGKLPLGEPGELGQDHTFTVPTWVRLEGGDTISLKGWSWKMTVGAELHRRSSYPPVSWFAEQGIPGCGVPSASWWANTSAWGYGQDAVLGGVSVIAWLVGGMDDIGGLVPRFYEDGTRIPRELRSEWRGVLVDLESAPRRHPAVDRQLSPEPVRQARRNADGGPRITDRTARWAPRSVRG